MQGDLEYSGHAAESGSISQKEGHMETAKAVSNQEENVIETNTEVILQYRNYEVNMDDVTERVKAHYIAKGYQADSIENIQIYVKPEDFTAYYVINDSAAGKVNLF